jgi:hypothetical protein
MYFLNGRVSLANLVRATLDRIVCITALLRIARAFAPDREERERRFNASFLSYRNSNT